ncbi:MAG: hypothetical protein SH817_14740, partial [Leptospira sp.]|nr:hypothetical protein [Leptospira sp.]
CTYSLYSKQVRITISRHASISYPRRALGKNQGILSIDVVKQKCIKKFALQIYPNNNIMSHYYFRIFELW